MYASQSTCISRIQRPAYQCINAETTYNLTTLHNFTNNQYMSKQPCHSKKQTWSCNGWPCDIHHFNVRPLINCQIWVDCRLCAMGIGKHPLLLFLAYVLATVVSPIGRLVSIELQNLKWPVKVNKLLYYCRQPATNLA